MIAFHKNNLIKMILPKYFIKLMSSTLEIKHYLNMATDYFN